MPSKKKPTTSKLCMLVDSNNHGGFGRWAFLEIVDPWDAKNTIRKFIKGEKVDRVEPIFKGE